MNFNLDQEQHNILEFENFMQEEKDQEYSMCEEEFENFVGNYPDFDRLIAIDQELDSLDKLMDEKTILEFEDKVNTTLNFSPK